jgi:hypothetical protein
MPSSHSIAQRLPDLPAGSKLAIFYFRRSAKSLAFKRSLNFPSSCGRSTGKRYSSSVPHPRPPCRALSEEVV